MTSFVIRKGPRIPILLASAKKKKTAFRTTVEPLGITNLYTTAVKALGITNDILSPSHSIQLSGEGEVNSTYQEAKHRGKCRALFTDPEGESCFSIYQQLNKNKKSNFL